MYFPLNSKSPREFALWWTGQGVDVVPVRPTLADNGKGKLAPHPYDKWEWSDRTQSHPPGRLITPEEVDAFWKEHPEAQLSIVLGDGLAAIDVDLKNLINGQPPDSKPVPNAFPGSLTERSKSGGLHLFFRYKSQLPEGEPLRWIGFGGYVDVLAAGLLFAVPSTFVRPDGSPGGECTLVNAGPVPEFDSIYLALYSSAQWLAEEWKERHAKAAAKMQNATTSLSDDNIPRPVDPEAVKAADLAVMSDPDLETLFVDGVKKENGDVDRSLTEWRLTTALKNRGFPFEVVWAIIQKCPNAKSPFDKRGIKFFIDHSWGKAESPVEPKHWEHPPAASADQTGGIPGTAPAGPPPGPYDMDDGFPVHVFPEHLFDYNKDDTPPIRSRFVSRLIEEYAFAAFRDSRELLVYHRGYYNGFAPTRIEQWVEAQFQSAPDGKTAPERFVNEVISAVRRRSYAARTNFNPEGKIRVANGILNIETMDFISHEEGSGNKPVEGEEKFTFKVPTRYEPSARCPEWIAFIESSVPKPKQRLDLQEYFGYTLWTKGNPFKKAMMNIGPKDCGKSTAVETVEFVIGKENIAAASLTELTDTKYGKAELYGKLANLYADIPMGRIRNPGVLKLLTGNDTLHGERKYQHPFKFRPFAKYIFSTNRLPSGDDFDDAFFSRWVFVEFEKPTRPLDRELPRKLEAEASGILNWMLEGLSRLLARKGFDPDVSQDSIEKRWRRESDSVFAFSEERLSPGKKDDTVPNSEMFGAYARYCSDNDVDAVSQKKFAERLLACVDGINHPPNPVWVGGVKQRAWTGVRFKVVVEAGKASAPVESYSSDVSQTPEKASIRPGSVPDHFTDVEKPKSGTDGTDSGGTVSPGGTKEDSQLEASYRSNNRPESVPSVPGDGGSLTVKPTGTLPGQFERISAQSVEPDPEDLFSGRETRGDKGRDAYCVEPSIAPMDDDVPKPVMNVDAARVDAAYAALLPILEGAGQTGISEDRVYEELGAKGFTQLESGVALARSCVEKVRMQNGLFFWKEANGQGPAG